MNRIYIILIVLLFSSCEKVIDLKLQETSPKIVIESILTDLNTRHTVSISYTTNFDNPNTKTPVSGASVVIKDENGTNISFTEQKSGNYLSTTYKGIPGNKYTITVTANGKSYSASSIMPYPVAIKSLEQIELTFFGETRKIVQLNYKDPGGIANFYYNRVFINKVKLSTFYVDSDRFNDGRDVKNTIFIDSPNLVVGDVVNVQLLTIDENIYKYLFSITQITGNGGPPTTPANPNSNFNNGALGFFSASTITNSSIIIK